MSLPSRKHAIVIGGSMAGLCAVRVLADHFEQVTLVERDAFTDTPAPRKGVPQGRQLHALLKRGEDVLEQLFPDLIPGLLAAGAVSMEMGTDFRWYHQGGWKVNAPSGVVSVSSTRPLLEQHVRRRVLALPNVRCLDGHEITGLVTTAGSRLVTGVKIRAKDTEDASVATLDATLVVDASGRGSAAPRWLESLGCATPTESIVKVNVGYASRVYQRPPAGTVPWKACYVIGPAPDNKRIGAIFSIEGGRWIAVLAGTLGEHPPSDEAGFMAFARGLPDPVIADALALATPLDDIALYRFPAHQRRHYELLGDLPDGFIAVGDAHCSFNPIYGQGMTCAALGALDLRACLEAYRGRDMLVGFSQRFQRALAVTVDGAWLMSTTEDFRYPAVEGPRPFYSNALKWYTSRVHAAVHYDVEVARAFYRAMHMLAPPTSLMHPAILVRVLFGRGKGSAGPVFSPVVEVGVAAAGGRR
ncbi:MAG: hypothetical protein Q8P41_15385 [Pseudomonadota bacterium]|nr:hypothetical protein [Pseudomonadota bacterium]